MMQWLTTFKHARPWTAYNGIIFLSGHLRPAACVKRDAIHPGMAS